MFHSRFLNMAFSAACCSLLRTTSESEACVMSRSISLRNLLVSCASCSFERASNVLRAGYVGRTSPGYGIARPLNATKSKRGTGRQGVEEEEVGGSEAGLGGALACTVG